MKRPEDTVNSIPTNRATVRKRLLVEPPVPTTLAPEPQMIDADAGPPDVDKVSAFILRHWLLIGLAALLGAVGGWMGAKVLPKIYRAEVLVVPVSPEGNSPLKSLIGQYGALAGLAGIDLGKEENSTAATLAMLKSRAFLQSFIEERKLLPILFAKQWDAKTSSWKLKEGRHPPTVQDAYGLFRKNVLSVVEDKESGLVTVRVEWRDPRLASEWANALVARTNETARTRAIRNSERSIQYLGKELEHTQAVEIRQSIYSLLQSQINKRMLANTRPDFAFSVIDPALTPEIDKFVRPVPLLMAAIGFFVGGLLAMMAVVLTPRLPRLRGGRLGLPFALPWRR